MKWSPILHFLTVVAAVGGFLLWIGAEIAGDGGSFLGFPQEHYYNDAKVLLLLAIALALGVLIHRHQEERQ